MPACAVSAPLAPPAFLGVFASAGRSFELHAANQTSTQSRTVIDAYVMGLDT
jgi:hypothetical protein